VDCASGVHMRLRLSGSTWPPRMMYRVYVHSTVANMMMMESGVAAPQREGEMPSKGWVPLQRMAVAAAQQPHPTASAALLALTVQCSTLQQAD
jgi:hypothetical protein